MPTLLEESDILHSCNDPDKEAYHRKNLVENCWLCDKQLTEWYTELTLLKELKPFDRKEEITLIDAMDLASAHLLTLYWATCVILYSVMRPAVPDIELPERANYIKTYCQKIIRTVPFFFHPAVGTFRAHLATFPIAVAMRYLTVFEPEEREVEKRLLDDCFARPEGKGIGKLLKSLDLETSKH